MSGFSEGHTPQSSNAKYAEIWGLMAMVLGNGETRSLVARVTLRPCPSRDLLVARRARHAVPLQGFDDGFEVVVAGGDVGEGVFGVVVFDDVPLGAGVFGGGEDFGPVEDAFADGGDGAVVAGGHVFDVEDG